MEQNLILHMPSNFKKDWSDIMHSFRVLANFKMRRSFQM